MKETKENAMIEQVSLNNELIKLKQKQMKIANAKWICVIQYKTACIHETNNWNQLRWNLDFLTHLLDVPCIGAQFSSN